MDPHGDGAAHSPHGNVSSASQPVRHGGVPEQQDRVQQQQQQQPSGSNSSTPSYFPSVAPLRTLSGTAPRRHPSTSSSLSNVTNYAEEGHGETEEDEDEDGIVQGSNDSFPAVHSTLPSTQQSPPKRPVNTFTRAGSGLPLAWHRADPSTIEEDVSIAAEAREASHTADVHHAPNSPVAPPSSGIAQQRMAAAAAAAGETGTATTTVTPEGAALYAGPQPAFSNVTHRRPHAPSLGAYSHSSTSSFGSSSSSPPTSHISSNPPGSARLGGPHNTGTGTAMSEGAFSPPTSVGTGAGSSGSAAGGLHSRQHSQQSPTLPIAITSSGQLANIGIGISNPTASASIPTSTVITQPTTTIATSPTASPAPPGPASLPPLSTLPQTSTTAPASVQTRLSTTPFLPSPLAQASLAPGEEEGEPFEMFGLDAAITADERKSTTSATTSPPWTGNMAFPTRERSGRTSDASTSSYTASSVNPPSVLRRSTSVSHAAGYKGSSTRRRISSISQQQQQQLPSSSSTTISPPLSSTISPPGGLASLSGTPASAAAAVAAQRPGSPSPLRKEASLLSMSRDALAGSTGVVPNTHRPAAGPSNSGSNSDTSSSNSGGNTHSPTPRPEKYQSIAMPPPSSVPKPASLPSASMSSAGSNNSPSASSSGDSPMEYRFPAPHQSVVSGGTSAFRARQMSISSSGSAASASSAPPRAQIAQGGLHYSPTSATKSLSPPNLSSLAMSASSPGLSYHVPSSSHRSNSVSVHNRGTHGRSESLTSALGISTGMASSPSSTSSAALSTSPSASFRPFPSAPPVATPSILSSSFNFSPSSSSASPAVSPPGSQHLVHAGLSPSSSFTSSVGGARGEAPAASGNTGGGIRLQRVPTSVRLAQELHPMSPAMEKRRLSIDPGSMSPAMAASTSSLSAFKIGGGEEATSSNSSSSETEYRRDGGMAAHPGLRLPATPMATRRNTPSPSGADEEAEKTLQAEDIGDTQNAEGGVLQPRTGLASPFHVHGAAQQPRQRSPSGSPSNISPSASVRSLSIPTPPLQNTSAYAPLFPFSMPRSAARSSLATSLNEPGPSFSPPSLSRSHSRSQSKGRRSPVINRLSPRMSSDPFSSNTVSPSTLSSSQAHLADSTVSPKTATFAQSGTQVLQSSLAKRNTISGLGSSMSASSLFEPVLSSADSPVAGSLSPPFKGPRSPAAAAESVTSPTSIKKQFRTSMMPGTISTSSTEDYARHLQESRASKLRKWATGTNQSDDPKLGLGGAGNTFGAGSDIQAGGGKARRRAGIPDFADFGFGTDRAGKDYRDELAGDLGIRPGTGGSREIEWVDWLDEYKKMKEAKIRAEQDHQRQQSLGDVEETAEAEGDDIALEMNPSSSLHSRKRSDEYSAQDSQSRRGSGGDQSDSRMPFPGSNNAEDSPELGTTIPPRPRRLSTASLASLSLLDAAKRKRNSQESLAGASRPAIPAAIVPRKTLGVRSISYAPPTAYSAMRQEEPQGPAIPQPKKRKNIASKIDAWWSAVTKSFTTASDERKSPPPPPPPMSIPTPAAVQSQLPPLPQFPPLTTDQLMPAVSIDPADLPGRVSAQYARHATTLPVPPNKLRHTASASDLTPEKKVYGGGQLPMGALAPAARIPTQIEPHPRLNSAGSDGDASSGSAGASRSEFKRRNPQLSLRLDPRFQPAVTAHKLGDRPALSRTSSTSISSGSGPPSQSNQAVFKEPRPPSLAVRQAEHTPNLTPGQSPIWDKTPGLVPMSQGQDFRLMRSASKSSASQKGPVNLPVAPIAPSFSMSHIREHIKHRLTGAKHNCDKELKKIVTGITVYVEKELENERAFASGLVSRQEEEDDMGLVARSDKRMYSESPAALFPNDESDAGNDAGDENDGKPSRPGLRHMDTGSSASTDPPRSGFGSPSTSYPQQAQKHAPQASARRGRTSGHASPRRASMPSKRHPLGAPVRPADLAARLERSLDLDKDLAPAGLSRTTSASTSRSRSPMPHLHSGSSVNRTSSAEWFKKHDAPEDEDKRSFLHSLQEIVTIAMEIQDTSVTDLTDDPSACAQLIRRVQKIGQRWDDHPNWPLRGWYVQLLLAVAGLSRVAEFWAEERGFWNFEDQKDANENDPILFVAKAPAQEEEVSVPTRPRSRAASTVLGLGRVPTREDKQSLTSSPLGVDLGIHRVEEEGPGDTSLKVSAPSAVPEEATRAEEAEVLREAVEEVRSVTILMELALDGESFQYLSPVWEDVVGLPPNVCLGRPISHLLHPDDAAVFAEASSHLQRDDSHTIEAQFRLRVFGDNEDPDDHSEESFEAMEGKGMLIRDRMHGTPSHTMWVIRPVPSQDTPSDDGEATTVRPPTASYIKSFGDSITPLRAGDSGRLPVQPILCRICDRQVPTWFFEKHNETCDETHRLEVDISDTNDKLTDLRSAANSILESLKTTDGQDSYSPPEYQDQPLLPGRYRDSQIRFLEEVMDALNMAVQVSTPALPDDQLPVEDQRLLSPNSEDHLSHLQGWQVPKSDDPALRRLGEDLVDLVRQKIIVVNRLRNTIVYVERIRLEWELQAQSLLASEPQDANNSQSPPPSPAPTILPSTQHSASTAHVEGVDHYEQPTPIMAKPNTFLGQTTTIPVQQIPDRESPVSFSSSSPAALLQPLPMIDPNYRVPASGSVSSQSMTLSPSLIPTSPRLASGAPTRNAKATTSIKDFDIIKPISKGAFGSVYLAKKRNTGDYYAIKVLKKADMIAKNQVTNVKAERKIMMTQADSDFAVKLYWTFQSKDYLYLVMEYLNGGDCASLIKVIGCLDEDWAKSYVAEIVLGLEYLHGRGIVHRDLKPDNLLIDSRGHLRLTDFGLSRFGLLGRQARTINQSSSQLSKRLHRRAIPKTFPQALSEVSTPDSQPRASYFGSITLEDPDAMSESSGSESVTDRQKGASRNSDSPAISMGSQSGKLLPHVPSPGKQSDSHRFVGTVDYVAPESILGVGVGEGVDWWALGVICHEFLTSFPPFHADTPEQVFDNILSRRVDWHEDEVEWSLEARDFVDRLLCSDPTRRLGAKGADEVKRHPFLRGIDWTKLREAEGNFVPQITDPESTDYFDDRGAATQVFQEDSVDSDLRRPDLSETRAVSDPSMAFEVSKGGSVNETPVDDFGTFNFKNLDVLKQANDDVIRKLRSDSVLPPAVDPAVVAGITRKARGKRNSIVEPRTGQPPSPSTSTTSSVGSGVSRPSLPNTPFAVLQAHKRRPSNQHGSRLKTDLADEGDAESNARRNSVPGNLRRSSFGMMDKHLQHSEGNWHQRRRTSGFTDLTPASSLSSPIAGRANLPALPGDTVVPPADGASAGPATEKTVDCLIAEDNPISSKILETILVRLGCLCVVVHNGEEAIRCSMGELAFDVIFMDMLMPICKVNGGPRHDWVCTDIISPVDGENAARMIKSTNNANQNTPIVAVTSYAAHERIHITEEGTLFNAVLTKPVSKTDVLNVLTKLGFVTKTKSTHTGAISGEPIMKASLAGEVAVREGPAS